MTSQTSQTSQSSQRTAPPPAPLPARTAKRRPLTSREDRWFDRLNAVFLLAVVAVIGYPLWFVLIASVSDPHAVQSGQVWLWPVGLNLDGYARVFSQGSIWVGYRNTVIYTIVGVALHLLIVLPCSYALSRRTMAGRAPVTWYILITMLFSGGIIPTYLVVKDLGMLDTLWAVVVPGPPAPGRSSSAEHSSPRASPRSWPRRRPSTARATSRPSCASRSRCPHRSSPRSPCSTGSGCGTSTSRR